MKHLHRSQRWDIHDRPDNYCHSDQSPSTAPPTGGPPAAAGDRLPPVFGCTGCPARMPQDPVWGLTLVRDGPCDVPAGTGPVSPEPHCGDPHTSTGRFSCARPCLACFLLWETWFKARSRLHKGYFHGHGKITAYVRQHSTPR